MGASLIFRCKERMKLEGHSSSLCQMDGKWRYPLPQCLAPCIVPHIDRGHVYVASDERDHINNVTVAEHGKRLVVECVQDYEFAAASITPVVCNNGTWSIVPTCSPARCKLMPKPPKNGMVIAPKTDHGMKAVFKCKDGFELVGGGPYNSSYSVECQYGNWTGDIPHCIEVYCPFPGYVQNGKVLLVGNMGVYDYRPYVKKVVNNKQIMYDCDKGYYLSEGPPGATCIGGSWSPKELPKCTLGQHPRIRWNRRRRSIGADKNETVVMAYRKFIDFFRKIGKKLLELEMEKSHEAMMNSARKEVNRTSNSTGHQLTSTSNSSSGSNFVAHRNGSSKAHASKARTRDEKMIDFLRIVYRKLQRIDSRHASNDTNVTMHELLNVMSKNFFHVDLSEPRRNASAKAHDSYESKSQREFTKLKREFERIMKFYNKSLRWSEKHLRKDLRKKKKSQQQQQGHQKDAEKADKHKTKEKKKEKQHKSPNYYKGFYEFINDYVSQKLTALEAQNATEELIRKMRIDKISVRNGTMFTVGEIYTFFKHIIEAKLNSSKADNETVSTAATTTIDNTSTTSTTTTSRTTAWPYPGASKKVSPTKSPRKTSTISPPRPTTTAPAPTTTATPKTNNLIVSENEIPALEIENSGEKPRSKRIRDASTRSPIAEVRRKLLSINHPLGGGESASFAFKSELARQQQGRFKRFLPANAELADNQMFLKNLYLNAYEEEYKANVKRSMSLNNQRASSWSREATSQRQIN
ncbi:hypothetical protein TSAR_000848 [Trichomalopsis sarcophagae]|uniref:Sushi domain-containing protein n=1 Tax=Trichomalopsis sarcophagae TaxID=543379 RepID=A0A232FFB5_9HYME|nr:hypothetical protein TSAR_000848 [Trichomalopsis sarcophagae]